ncbi:TPA: RCC1 domain-containing protein [Elizabethkingia anophelis]|uniref:RCC1 domain-containing protein n=1 Tax=Elizabethkingia anophelis TaxID=1117645 RepID=UPI0016231BED|nr:chromosome condensation regulator RCC1 [Elizabethkingia anophelis]MCT3671589.1 chromosome condensation regulator RCC1 [Elizabethkingia anophelis]MCT3679441.1 chromosome condensation regulator RCC1 [Elizabethkingia anophelis]MCT3704299.1 chromosome condensation regulator RCC1 [Elizabethkingia anophelis]MCT3769254.1 chromosome condensation regulator RCC1 [Elizabethkingia anophelis]MCT3779572.1 chromosome condensation regulator RCC1 [Elizabethkingia anophelis]
MEKQFLTKNRTFIFLCLSTLFLFLSCRSANDDTIKDGIGILKINMRGTEFSGNERSMLDAIASISPFMKGTIRNENTDVEIARIPLKGDYVLIASLSPEAPASGQGLQASTLNNIQAKSSISKVPNGVKYRVVVYDSEGGYVDQKVYTTGQNTSDDGQDFKLNGGSTYKFVVFSYNNAEVPPSVTSTYPKSCDISGNQDFMYYTKEMVISGQTTNYLDVVMQHKYTQVNVTLNTSEIGVATEVSGVGITPHHANNKIDLTTGAITYDNTPVIKPFTLSNSLDPNILTGSTLICAPEGTATISFASMILGGEKQPNRSTALHVTPGNNINLKLTVQRNLTINVMQIASSWYHTVAMTASGDVYGTGHVEYGELGPVSFLQEKPAKRPGWGFSEYYIRNFNKLNIDNAKKIAVSDGSTYVLKKNGELYVAGLNDFGQLGIGTRKDTGSEGNFVKVEFFGGVIKDIIAAGLRVFILTEDGKLFAAGRNKDAELGVGDTDDSKQNFVRVKGLDGLQVEQVAAGEYHVIVKTTDGKVYGAGRNYSGQLADIGDPIPEITVFKEIIIPQVAGKDIKSLVAGRKNTFILTNTGVVLATGENDQGQLGLGDKKNRFGFETVPFLSNISSVYSYRNHAIAITTSGELYASGYNRSGQLGTGDTKSFSSFTRISTMTSPIASALYAPTADHTIIVGYDGQVYGTGDNKYAVLGLGTISVEYSSYKNLPLSKK